MAGKTLIGGTAYKITGGKATINGVARKVTGGKTMIGGTVYSIKFGKGVAVTITGTGNSTYCYATINGTKYSAAASNITVTTGDVITFGVYGTFDSYGSVMIDGNNVLYNVDSTTKTYNWTVPDSVKTISIKFSYRSSKRSGNITVTTTK